MKIRILLWTCLITSFGFSQSQSNDFEFNDNLDVTIDTSNQENIWQIGAPQKNIFSAAYSGPNAIVTDTLNTYPIGQNSSFEIELSNGVLGWFPFVQVEWFQQTDMENGVDGGIIEASYDGGQTWRNIFSDPDFLPEMVGNFQTDTLFNGQVGITGTHDWSWMAICWGNYSGTLPDTDNGVKVRYTLVSDSTDTQQDGWMMDNFFILSQVIGSATSGLSRIQGIPIYPNPAMNELQIDLKDINTSNSMLQILNISGQKIYEETLDLDLELHRISLSDFPHGLYFLKIDTVQGFYSQTFVKVK